MRIAHSSSLSSTLATAVPRPIRTPLCYPFARYNYINTPLQTRHCSSSTHHHKHNIATMPSIPQTQTAAVVQAIGKPIEVRDSHPVKQPKDLRPGECLVKISHTGVCHTDLHAKQGDWPVKPMNPLIGGHEGVGEIVAIGEHTYDSPVKLGDRVGIKWLADSCIKCDLCRRGFEMSECDRGKVWGWS